MKDLPAQLFRHNASMNGLRGLSSLLVVVYHVYAMSVAGGLLLLSKSSMTRLLDNTGDSAVMVFFMISGYLISQTLDKNRNIRRFLLNRLIRIYPLFLILHCFLFAVGPAVHFRPLAGYHYASLSYLLLFVSNLLMLPGIFDLHIVQKNAWSLSFELAFYTIACGLFSSWLLCKSRRVTLGSAVFAISAGLAILMVHQYPDALFFAGGVIIYLMQRNTIRLGSKVSDFGPVGLISLASLFIVFHQYSLLLALATGLLFFASVARQTGWLSSILQIKPLQHMGAISYSLYLLHPFTLEPARSLMLTLTLRYGLPQPVAAMLFGLLGLSAAIALSTVSYRYIETSLTQHLKARLFPKPPPDRSGTLTLTTPRELPVAA